MGPRAHRIALAVLFVLAAGGRSPAGVDLTLDLGLRTGGQVESVGPISRRGLDVDAGLAYGLIVDIPLQSETFATVLWSGQSTAFETGGALPGTDHFDLGIHYFQAGAGYRPVTRGGFAPFVAMTAGLTWYDPEPSGFDSDLGLSLTISGGAKLPITDRLGLRFEGRGLLTLTTASLSGSCGPDACTFQFTGSGLFQFEALIGLTISF